MAGPRPTKGAGKAAWVEYAQSLGLEVADDARVSDILEAVKAEEAEIAASAEKTFVPFDDEDPNALIRHAVGSEFVSIDGVDYVIDPLTGYPVGRL